MKWFSEARYGMFIHWGIYTVPAGQWQGDTDHGEWFQLTTNMPCTQYDRFAAQFNPQQFDARRWAKLASDAGMKYVVVTAKHHDGFCMYHSKLTPFNIVDATPYGRDPMKELADAVRAQGLVFCFYCSIPDWHHPDFPTVYSNEASTDKPGFHGNPKPEANLDAYVDYMKLQLRELLSNYGPIGMLWFDHGGAMPDDATRARLIHAQEILDLIHELQPDCLVNDRLGLPGDFATPEQRIPGQPSPRPFEVCMTLNRHWGYNSADQDFKSPTQVIHNLADIAHKGGNYLLNVGPTADGAVPEESVEILLEVGSWLRRNGESIYSTSGSPLSVTPSWGRVTQKGGTCYLHVLDWPSDGRLRLEGLPADMKRATLLADPALGPLQVARDHDGVTTITVPPAAPDQHASVIAIETMET